MSEDNSKGLFSKPVIEFPSVVDAMHNYVGGRKMKRKALIVGINYLGTANQLNGCVQDSLLWQSIITEQFGFKDALNRRMLIDASATTESIISRLNWLVSDNQIGDELFFNFSGHGSQIPASTDYELKIEPDGLCEVLIPVDVDWREKIITDKMLAKIFSQIPEGVNLTCVIDACHSGDIGRNSWNPMIQPSPCPNKIRRILAPPDIMNRGFGLDLQLNRALSQLSYEDSKNVIISGSKSTQTSADAFIQTARKYQGAASWYLSENLKKNNFDITNEDLVLQTRESLKINGYEQEPELDAPMKLYKRKFLGGKV